MKLKHAWGLEQFLKSMKLFSDKNYGKNKRQEQSVEPQAKPIALVLILLSIIVTGCVDNKTSFSRQFVTKEAALPLMERVVQDVSRCWFQAKIVDFKPYRLAPELNSFSGRPRLLLVPHDKPTARPHLVIEASGNPAQLNIYGSLLASKTGKRILNDLTHLLESPRTPLC